jgi:uncharacterized membrane protein YdfJ with MMPL/SSD domain
MELGVRHISRRLGRTARRVRWGVLATWLAATVIGGGFWEQVAMVVIGPRQHPPADDAGVERARSAMRD